MKHFGYLLALLLSIPTFAAGAPPVEYPQACAPTYCVQIIATHPDQPQKFVIQHNAKMGTATMTVDMGRGFRSEEQTYELQSLMRISYAVFCLKKKKTHKQISTT